MLITFKSKAAADVLMYDTHAKPLLDLLGKDAGRGIITAAESGPAIARIEQAIADGKVAASTGQDPTIVPLPDDAEPEQIERSRVSLSTRAYPLLEMLRAAQRGGNDVMWGV
jgi:hypothetical protein